MQVKMTHTAKLVHFLVLGCILFGSGDVWSQSKYEIAITDIQYQKVYKNWLRIPHSVDLRVFWAATKTEKAITLETGGIKEVELEESSYRLFIYTEGKNNEPIVQEIKNENHADVKSVNIGEKLSFKVKAFDSQANLLAESAMASVMVGKDNDEINDALVDSPEVINDDPYGDAWMLKVEMSNSAEIKELLTVDEYRKYVEEEK